MIVWRLKWKISELFCAVLCITVVCSDTHMHEQFLSLCVGLV